MPRKLTNKQLVVLELLRSNDEMTVDQIAEIVTKQTPCGECFGTGEGDHMRHSYKTGKREPVCGKCWGRGTAFFHYSDAYQALKRLRAEGLVTRRCQRDEWGDELPRHVYSAVAVNPDDPLEQAFALPTRESRHE